MSALRHVSDWARIYRSIGWSVIPLRSREKRPLIPWEPLQVRAATDEEIADWFARWPDANLGIVTGAISNLVVLDVDPTHGGDRSLEALEAHHGRLPRTLEAATGGGGRHFYFSHPDGFVRNRVGIAAGVDLRGDGGYVVAPPSIHPSGAQYLWVAGRTPTRGMLAPMPHWLVESPGIGERGGHPLAYWRSLIREGVSEGARNNTIASLVGRLLWHDLDPEMITELMLCWNSVRCRPPLPDSEVVATVESIVRTHHRTRVGMT